MDRYDRDRLERKGVKRLSLLKPYIRKYIGSQCHLQLLY